MLLTISFLYCCYLVPVDLNRKDGAVILEDKTMIGKSDSHQQEITTNNCVILCLLSSRVSIGNK